METVWLSVADFLRNRNDLVGSANAGCIYHQWIILNPLKISCICSISLSCPNVVKFYTGHVCINKMLCAKYQNHWITEKKVMCVRDFTRFEFKIERFSILQQQLDPCHLANVYTRGICLAARAHSREHSTIIQVPGNRNTGLIVITMTS